jgi:hypothetical protein
MRGVAFSSRLKVISDKMAASPMLRGFPIGKNWQPLTLPNRFAFKHSLKTR